VLIYLGLLKKCHDGGLIRDHRNQEILDDIFAGRADLFKRIAHSGALKLRQLLGEIQTFFGQIEMAYAAVGLPGLLTDEAFVNQLLENSGKRLLGYAKDVEQVGDAQPGVTRNKVYDPMMCPAIAEIREQFIGVAGEITIGKEQQLDELHLLVGR